MENVRQVLGGAPARDFDFDDVAFVVESDGKERGTGLQNRLLRVQLGEVLLRPKVAVYCWLGFAFGAGLLAIEL